MAKSRQHIDYQLTLTDIVDLIEDKFDIILPMNVRININPSANDRGVPEQVVVTVTTFGPVIPAPPGPPA